MRNLIILALIIIGGGWYWYKNHSSQAGVWDEAGNPAVVVYTAPDCGVPCRSATDMLDGRRVPYQEKVLDLSNEQDEDVRHWRSVGGNTLPFTQAGLSSVRGSSKWELIGLLGENFAGQYLTAGERGYFQRHFDASGKPGVALYGADWCPTCAQLRKDLRENGVDFVDIDVEKSGDFDRLVQVMEIPGYPAVWVGYHRVHGTNFSAVKAVMN